MLDVSQLQGGIPASLERAQQGINTVRRHSHMQAWEGYLSIVKVEHKTGYARTTYPILWSSNKPTKQYQKKRGILEVHPMKEE